MQDGKVMCFFATMEMDLPDFYISLLLLLPYHISLVMLPRRRSRGVDHPERAVEMEGCSSISDQITIFLRPGWALGFMRPDMRPGGPLKKKKKRKRKREQKVSSGISIT